MKPQPQPEPFLDVLRDFNRRADAAEDQEQTGMSIREIEEYLADLRGDRQREQEGKEQ